MALIDAFDRYEAKFGEMPPIFGWSGDDDHLESLIDRAVTDD
jgi:hypothetical protein